jgi:hypothetical protein
MVVDQTKINHYLHDIITLMTIITLDIVALQVRKGSQSYRSMNIFRGIRYSSWNVIWYCTVAKFNGWMSE